MARRGIFEEENDNLAAPQKERAARVKCFYCMFIDKLLPGLLCGGRRRRRILRIYSKLSIVLEKYDGTKPALLVLRSSYVVMAVHAILSASIHKTRPQVWIHHVLVARPRPGCVTLFERIKEDCI